MAEGERALVLDPERAATILESKLRGFRGDLTVADAAARSGLALRDAETGLQALVARYRGHLAATSGGELLFRFPQGLVKPREQRGFLRAIQATGRALAGVGRFVVRAWVSVVAIGYAALFGVVLLALAARDEGDGVGHALGFLFRFVAEAVFWTVHPFSPFRLDPVRPSRRLRRGRTDDLPFYERVNRFVFGPPPAPQDPLEQRRRVIAEIRHQHGRIGIGDVMRVTGLGRGEADALVSQLLLDFEGEIQVTDDAAIVYVFRDIRRTAALGSGEPSTARPLPYYARPAMLQPITGNGAGTNWLFGALNGFNLAVSGWALANDLTFERLGWILQQVSSDTLATAGAGPEGLAIALGLVPFTFSLALFMLPLARVLRRQAAQRKVEAENGRRALASLVLEQANKTYPVAEIEARFARGAGRRGSEREILDAVWSLGGDYDLDDNGTGVYRFENLVAEQRALTGLREQASIAERSVGSVVFSSDDD